MLPPTSLSLSGRNTFSLSCSLHLLFSGKVRGESLLFCCDYFYPSKHSLRAPFQGIIAHRANLLKRLKKKKNSSSLSKYQAADESGSSESRGNINHFLLKTHSTYFIASHQPHSALYLSFRFPLCSTHNTVSIFANSLKSKSTFVNQ